MSYYSTQYYEYVTRNNRHWIAKMTKSPQLFGCFLKICGA